MKHYHVMVGPMGTEMTTNVRFDNYEDSISTYLRLVRAVYEDRLASDELTIERMAENTANSKGFYIGVSSLAFLWVPCADEPCMTPVWN